MAHVKVFDANVLDLQGQAINQIINEIDRILDIVYEQQEEIACLYACIDELERLIKAKEL